MKETTLIALLALGLAAHYVASSLPSSGGSGAAPPPPPGAGGAGGTGLPPSVPTPSSPVDASIGDSDPFVFDVLPSPPWLDSPEGAAWRDLFVRQIYDTASRLMPSDEDMQAATAMLSVSLLAAVDPNWQGLDMSDADSYMGAAEKYVNVVPLVGQLFSGLLKGFQSIEDAAAAASDKGWSEAVNGDKSVAPPVEFLSITGGPGILTELPLPSKYNPGAPLSASEGGTFLDCQFAMPGTYRRSDIGPDGRQLAWAVPWQLGKRTIWPRAILFTLIGGIGVNKLAGPFTLPWHQLGQGRLGTRARCRIAAGIYRAIDLMACKTSGAMMEGVSGVFAWRDDVTLIGGQHIGDVLGSIFPRLPFQGRATGRDDLGRPLYGAAATAAGSARGAAPAGGAVARVPMVSAHLDPAGLAARLLGG